MQRPSDMMDDEEDEDQVPVFAAEAEPPPSRFDDDRRAPADDDWNPRRRAPPPPRTKPPFRPIEDEYDDEPSGFSRFALGLSSVLSFGLYAALAGRRSWCSGTSAMPARMSPRPSSPRGGGGE